MAAPPAFQFYASDWAHSVSDMTLEERGAYITLLAWSWERGPVPNDMKRLAVILGTDLDHAKRVLDEVLKRWYLDDAGAWRNRRLELVRETQKTFSQSQADKGKRGAQTRWGRRAADRVAGANSPANDPAIARLVTDAVPGQSPDDSSPISDLRSLDHPLNTDRSGGSRARDSAPSLINGADLRVHGTHAWCSTWVGRDGLCVTFRLHLEFVGRLGGADADGRLKAWYPAVVRALEGVPIGDRRFDFWENQFAAWVGTVTSKPSSGPPTRGAKNSQVWDEVANALESKRENRDTATEGRAQVAVRRSAR